MAHVLNTTIYGNVGKPDTVRQGRTKYARLMLSATEAGHLVRLRWALHRAQDLANDTTEPGRHVALIALDGACEYALFVAAHHLGVSTGERASFHEAIVKVSQRLQQTWSPQPGGPGVVQMHSARNQAQHAGALPDPALMPGWSIAAGEFVTSLIAAAFAGQQLNDVVYASAIEDEELAGLLSQAERELNRGAPTDSFDYTVKALLVARRRWRSQQGDAYGLMATYAPFEDDPLYLDASSRASDYADVAVFADDVGEYHTLLATRRQRALGVMPSTEDARRALIFAFHWVLRWEAFNRRYPADEWRRRYAALGSPTTADDGLVIQRVAVGNRQHISHADRLPVTVQLANIPEHNRGTWGLDLDGTLTESLKTLSQPPSAIIAGERSLSGTIVFWVDAGMDGEAAAIAIRRALDRVSRSYERRRTSEAERAQKIVVLTDDFTKAIEHRGAGHFRDVQVAHEVRHNGDVFVVSMLVGKTDEEIVHAAQIFSGCGGLLAATSFVHGRLVFDAFALSDESLAVVDQAVLATVEQIDHLRAVHAEQAAERLAFISRLEDALLRRVESVDTC